MFVLGVLALFQMIVLPGALILRLFQVSLKGLKWLWVAFGLSLVANYWLVLTLSLLKLYTQPVILVVFVCESALLGWLVRPSLGKSIDEAGAGILNQIGTWIRLQYQQVQQLFNGTRPGENLIAGLRVTAVMILMIMAGSAVYWMATVTIQNVGQVFNTWDAVLSWNRWAVEWASGQIPQHTDRYPQLLPANISLTYVFIANSQVQLFAKAVMPLFGSGILLILFDLGLQMHPVGFFSAVVLARLMLKKFLGEFLTDGYADIPAAFFMTTTAGSLFFLQQAKRRETAYQYLILGAIFAAGAALSKQTGLVVVILLPFVIYILLRGSEILSHEVKGKWLLQAALICLVLALPWYAVKEYQIATGIDDSNLAYVAGSIHREPNPLNRIIPAFGLLDKYAFLFLLILPVIWKFDRLSFTLTMVILAPYTLGWATFFSYEVRTFAMALPLLALSAGMAVEKWLDLGFWLIKKIHLYRLRIGVLLLILIALLGGSGLLITRERLLEQQVNHQKEIFGANLNQKIYDYARNSSTPLMILTNYPLAYLPGLENSALTFYFNDYQVYDSLRRSGGFTHILMPGSVQETIRQDIQQRIDSGEFQVIFEDTSYGLYLFIKAR